MIIVDTEYTTWPGALEGGWSEPGQHREIVQIAAISVNDAFEETASLDLLVKPAINGKLSDLFTTLTGLRQDDVDAQGLAFAGALSVFHAFTDGDPVICMNADEAVFRENCRLTGTDFPFAASWHRLRPFLEAQGVDLSALLSGDLHALTPHPLTGHTHNALHDVRSMAAWLAHAKEVGTYTGPSDLPTGAPTTDPRSRRA